MCISPGEMKNGEIFISSIIDCFNQKHKVTLSGLAAILWWRFGSYSEHDFFILLAAEFKSKYFLVSFLNVLHLDVDPNGVLKEIEVFVDSLQRESINAFCIHRDLWSLLPRSKYHHIHRVTQWPSSLGLVSPDSRRRVVLDSTF